MLATTNLSFPPIGNMLAFSAFAGVTAITPGPNNALAAATGTNFGWRAACPQAVGVTVGGIALLITSMLGMATLLAAHPRLAWVFALAAATYLLWSAQRLWRTGGKDGLRGVAKSSPPGWIAAACFQFANPKAWMTALTASTFIAGVRPVAPAIAMLCMINAAACFPSVVGWAYAGSALRSWLAEGERLPLFNRAMALCLAAVAAWMVCAGIPTD
jgi:threonine/homoserine/homoserine lactone efflux protein